MIIATLDYVDLYELYQLNYASSYVYVWLMVITSLLYKFITSQMYVSLN